MIPLAVVAALQLSGVVAPPPDSARRDTVPPRVAYGGFIDGYYAWDAGRPRALDRAFTTQPARHNEFNINLAFVEAVLTGERMRGRLALQAGTSVQSNSFAEPQVGAVSGGVLSRTIQEATVGLRLHPRLWWDGGIYFSYVGLEGWISRDNPTYTRSLIADYTPYYLSGAKLTWQAGPTVTAQLHLMNGWQNVSETNADKAVGARVDWTPRPTVLLGWAAFTGNEQPDSLPSRVRVLSQFLGRWTPPGMGAVGRGGPGAAAAPRGGHRPLDGLDADRAAVAGARREGGRTRGAPLRWSAGARVHRHAGWLPDDGGLARARCRPRAAGAVAHRGAHLSLRRGAVAQGGAPRRKPDGADGGYVGRADALGR